MAQLVIPMDSKRFATGLNWKDYMAQMGDTRARTESNYSKSELTDDERKFFGGVTGVKYVVMLAENWCGDVHRNSPLIAHICDAMPGAELRVFFRDQNADLRDTFLNNGYQSIPVVVFFDKDWNEIGRWMERAHAATTKAAVIRSGTIDVAPRQGSAGRGDERVPQAGPVGLRGARCCAVALGGQRSAAAARAAARPRQEVSRVPSRGDDAASARVVAPAILLRQLVQPKLQPRVQLLVGRRQHVVELLGSARAHDR